MSEPNGEGLNPDELYEVYKGEQDRINAGTEFKDTYGFEHNCRCADDWAEGNLGVVSMCYLGMTQEAMDLLQKTRQELLEAQTEVSRLRVELEDARA